MHRPPGRRRPAIPPALTSLTYTILFTYLTTAGNLAAVPVTVTRDGPAARCWSSQVFPLDDFGGVPGDAQGRARPTTTYHQLRFGWWFPPDFAPDLAGNIGPSHPDRPCVFHRFGAVPPLRVGNSYWSLTSGGPPPDWAAQRFEYRGSDCSKVLGYDLDRAFSVRAP